MNTITVDKARLLLTLTANRSQHRAIFEEAQKKYREAMITELDRALEDARRGRRIVRAFALPEPRDFTDQFDTAIDMLAWEVGDEVELEQHDFERYVLNKWEWASAFTASTQAYVG